MLIGIDVRALGGASGRRGVGSYIRGLLSGLASELGEMGPPGPPPDEILMFRHRDDQTTDLPARFLPVTLTRPRRAITLWDQIAWPALLASRRVAVFHSPFYAVPRFHPARCAIVQTVHDLTPLKLPGAVSPRNARIFRMNFRLARAADRIIVPSRATRDDVVSLLGVEAARVAVIPEASDITVEEVQSSEADVDHVRGRLGIKGAYLLHTGGHDVVKNLPRLMDAFAALIAQGRDLFLVIAGEHTPHTSAMIARAARMGLLPRVILPGYVPRADLVALYRGASALVYPSWTEGFGLPVLEAMACGTPVVASGTGAIPEVGGDACLYFDPSDAGGLVTGIARILDDKDLAQQLSRTGRARASQFTWRETARRTLAVYREAAA